MSLPLKDVRSAVPEATDMWLEIEAARRAVDKATVVRDVLNEWAKGEAHGPCWAVSMNAGGGSMSRIIDFPGSIAARPTGAIRIKRRIACVEEPNLFLGSPQSEPRTPPSSTPHSRRGTDRRFDPARLGAVVLDLALFAGLIWLLIDAAKALWRVV
jgi:hypothetical protein